MKSCEQTTGLSVYDHGCAVHEQWLAIRSSPPELLNIPQLWEDISKFNYQDIKDYHIFHDCGKPRCLEIIDGKSHFPNHAEVSYQTWLEIDGRNPVATWIRNDMLIHVIKACDLEGFT